MRPARLLTLLLVFASLLASAPLRAQGSLFQPSLLTRPDVKAALDSIDARANAIVEEWIRIVQIPAPSKKEQARAAYIKAELDKLGVTDVRVDELSNVSAVRKGTGGGPTVVFAAHMDTVFPDGTDITVKRDGDVLRGPGVGDDTSNLTATLEMFRALDRGGIKTKGDLIFLATAQEEIGLVGAAHWLKTSGYTPDMFIAVDLGADQVWYGALRITNYKFFFTSDGAHTMESRDGPSPAKAVSHAIAAVHEIPLPPVPAGLGSFKLPVINVGMLGGGTVFNAVPREAWFTVDLRSLDTPTQARLEQAVEDAAKRVADREKVGFRVEKTAFFDYTNARPRDTRLNSPVVQTAVATANHFRKPGTPAIVPMDVGSTDANTAISLGIPAVAVGAVTQRFAHRLEENADASSIVPGIKHLIALAVSLAGELMTIVAVDTAVPAFVGYTEKADRDRQSLLGQPFRITSMAEYTAHFGGAWPPTFSVEPADATSAADSAFTSTFVHDGRRYRVTRTDTPFLLFASLALFFANGGRECYVVSVGGYAGDLDASALTSGIDALLPETTPTLLVVPDAVRLPIEACAAVQQAMVADCGKMINRFAILDVPDGFRDRRGADPIASFRLHLGDEARDRAAAYYPWLHTDLVQPSSIVAGDLDASALPVTLDDAAAKPLLDAIAREAARIVNLLPPSAAIAGIYATVDASRGIWKAPANAQVKRVVAPAVAISDREQDDLIILNGASINPIRSFVDRGTLVWGARTLDGNDHDRRYISVRRTLSMIEASIRPAIQALASDPNTAATWTTVKAMIENFLIGLWRNGGLIGTKPEHAFAVRVGLGETMTQADVDAGVLRVEVLVALVRPAEFVTIRIEQQMNP